MNQQPSRQAGKGSRPRHVHGDTFRANHDSIFAKKDAPLLEKTPAPSPLMGMLLDTADQVRSHGSTKTTRERSDLEEGFIHRISSQDR